MSSLHGMPGVMTDYDAWKTRAPEDDAQRLYGKTALCEYNDCEPECGEQLHLTDDPLIAQTGKPIWICSVCAAELGIEMEGGD